MATNESSGQALVWIAVACAVVTTGIAIKRELVGATPKPPLSVPARVPVTVNDWPGLQSTGHRMGPANAPLTIVEFGDFQCPACRRFTNTTLKAIRKQYPNDVSVVFRHWPLSYHKFAMPAAIAAECAAQQGRFEAVHDLFYEQQAMLPTKPMSEFAKDAGVKDLDAFRRCSESAATHSAIAADSAVVTALKSPGTPTLIINGMLWMTVPDSAALDKLVREATKH